VTVRQWLVPAAFAAGVFLGAGSASAADGPKTDTASKPVFAFGSLKGATADAAKAKAGASLKAAGKFDQEKFTAVWANEGRSVQDRTVESLLAVSDEFKAVLAEARKPETPAPTAVPALLKDAKLDAFTKANLAAAYSKALATKRVYEESLEATKGVQPEQLVDPAAFYFYKAVAEHSLIQREAAVTSLARLLDDVTDTPDRYRVTATLMFFDIQNWAKDEKDLSQIAKLMDNSGRRLDLSRGGPKTQDIQKKIVFRLDEKIKELEAQQKKGGGQCNCPDGGGSQPGNGGGQPNGPMQDSNIATNGGPGQIDIKKLRAYEEKWGTLPDAERKKIVQEITRDLPAKYKPMIEDYFKSLNRMHGIKDK